VPDAVLSRDFRRPGHLRSRGKAFGSRSSRASNTCPVRSGACCCSGTCWPFRRRGGRPAGHHDRVREEHAAAGPGPAAGGVPSPEDIAAPTEPAARALLDQYIAAFQNSDAASLERLLSRDATLEATPWRTWYAGRATCVPFLRRWVLGAPGDWRMVPTMANGQPAAVGYARGRPYGVVVLTVTGGRISRVVSFQEPALVARFGPVDGTRIRFDSGAL